MKTILKICAAVSLAFLAGCLGGAPRLFQSKVPAPLSAPPGQLEAQRRAADLLARKLEAPVVLKPVAAGLSASLGAPDKPIPAGTTEELVRGSDTAIAELTASVRAMQKQILELNKALVRHQGKEIEGTGFSLLGPGMTTVVIGLVVLAVACPPALALMAFAYRRLKATAKIVVNQIEEAAQAPETKEAVEKIKTRVSKKMGEHSINTNALKSVILDLKKA